MSVKSAVESLGLGRCYHMNEVFRNPEHVPVWNAACDGHMPDWRRFLAGYAATLDTPACLFWKELALAFPKAKVLLLRRDPEKWYESVYSTIYQVVMSAKEENDPALLMIRRLFFEKEMAGRFEDRDFAIATYQRYCELVTREVPADSLLVYEVSQGWAPLCRFLGLEAPPGPFPERNTRAQFRERNRLA